MSSIQTGASQTYIAKEDWSVKLQERLNKPTIWKEIGRVIYSNYNVLNNPYLTDPTVHTLAAGSAYTYDQVTETNEFLTIAPLKIIPQHIDRGVLAMSGYLRQMEMADIQGTLLNEALEAALYAEHANFTDFGLTDSTGGAAGDTATITVSINNIDDIVTNIIRVIRVANGQSLLARNGGFVVWRPGDFMALTQFMMNSGFSTADRALTQGVVSGIDYMGLTHYSSNSLVANHVFAGVKKTEVIGVLQDTYGQIMVDEHDPAQVSGVSVVSRLDAGFKTFTKVKPVLLDVNVA